MGRSISQELSDPSPNLYSFYNYKAIEESSIIQSTNETNLDQSELLIYKSAHSGAIGQSIETPVLETLISLNFYDHTSLALRHTRHSR